MWMHRWPDLSGLPCCKCAELCPDSCPCSEFKLASSRTGVRFSDQISLASWLRLSVSQKVLYRDYTVIRFVLVSAKFDTCTVVTVNETLVEAKMCTFTLEFMHFIFNKCLIYTHDCVSALFSTSWDETDYCTVGDKGTVTLQWIYSRKSRPFTITHNDDISLFHNNRSRTRSVHIHDDCHPSLLRFSEIFRNSSIDRTAHEKKRKQQCDVENIQSKIMFKKGLGKFNGSNIFFLSFAEPIYIHFSHV